MFKNKNSWDLESKNYNELVGDRGHYYHEHVVIPNSLKMLNLKIDSSLLDLGCGQGVIAKRLKPEIKYVGVDASRALVNIAVKTDKNPKHEYIEASATRPLKNLEKDFTHVVFILSLQNMEYQQAALKNASDHLRVGGVVLLVLNHPAFRIPRQSGWGEHPNKLQYRWVNKYLNSLKIPITMHPGHNQSAVTMSYHYPVSFYVKELTKLGFVVTDLEEWASDKVSNGKFAKMENRSRTEIPLFMAILAKKQ